MITIGIINGNESYEAIRILTSLCEQSGLRAHILTADRLHKENEEIIDIGICQVTESDSENELCFDILVVNDRSYNLERCIAQLEWNNMLVLNADNKDIYPILSLNKGILITYGFNSKASVTASSVMDGEVQVCLQRGLPTIDSKTLEQQEFSVFCQGADRYMYGLLAAVTVAIVSGIDVGKIRGAVV